MTQSPDSFSYSDSKPSSVRKALGGLLVATTGLALLVAYDGPGAAWLVEKVPQLSELQILAGKKPAEPAKPAPNPQNSASQVGRGGAAGGRPPVSILAAEVEKKLMPVRFDGLGSVQPIAQVTLRSRIDSQIDTVFVADGAQVKAGDLLFSLDNRQINAQIKQAEAAAARNQATLDGLRRDVERIGALVDRDASARKLLDDARTKASEMNAQTKADQATLENLRIQLGYTEIRAPISGRFGLAGLKAGAIVRQGEATSTLGNIIQLAPIYVAFGVPQRLVGELRTAMQGSKPAVTITGAGLLKPSEGTVSFLDNTFDPATGMIMARAEISNTDENLWPGALVNVRLTIRSEDQVVVPATAIQSGQSGPYAYVIKENVAQMRPVELVRTQDGEAIISKGLQQGETVATDGQLNLSNGAPVTIRKPQQPPQSPSPQKKSS